MKYVDPDGRETTSSIVIINNWSSTTTRTITENKQNIDLQEFYNIVEKAGIAWAKNGNNISLKDLAGGFLTVAETTYSVADITITCAGSKFLPFPANVITTGAFLLSDFLMSIADKNILEANLKKLFFFKDDFNQYKPRDGWKLAIFTVNEVTIEESVYYDRNSPYTTISQRKYLEIQAFFYNPENDLDGVEDITDYETVYEILEYK